MINMHNWRRNVPQSGLNLKKLWQCGSSVSSSEIKAVLTALKTITEFIEQQPDDSLIAREDMINLQRLRRSIELSRVKSLRQESLDRFMTKLYWLIINQIIIIPLYVLVVSPAFYAFIPVSPYTGQNSVTGIKRFHCIYKGPTDWSINK